MSRGYFATPVLKSLAEDKIEQMSVEEKSALVAQYYDLRGKIKSNDWLVNMLCQYNELDQLTLSDSLFYALIKKMVFNDSLYLRLIPLQSWAYKDSNLMANMKNLSDAGIDAYEKESSLTCDAEFTCEDLDMTMLTQYDHQVNHATPTIVADISGAVEFGTQSMAKTAFNLFIGTPLIRVPYKIPSRWAI